MKAALQQCNDLNAQKVDVSKLDEDARPAALAANAALDAKINGLTNTIMFCSEQIDGLRGASDTSMKDGLQRLLDAAKAQNTEDPNNPNGSKNSKQKAQFSKEGLGAFTQEAAAQFASFMAQVQASQASSNSAIGNKASALREAAKHEDEGIKGGGAGL